MPGIRRAECVYINSFLTRINNHANLSWSGSIIESIPLISLIQVQVNKKVGRDTSYFLFTISCYLFVVIKAHRFTCSLQQFIFFLATYYHVFKLTQTCTCRDWVTGDNVLFQSKHVICLTLDGRRAEYFCCFLEGSSRDPALCSEGSFGDTKQQRLRSSCICITEFSELLVVPAEDRIFFLPNAAVRSRRR